MLAREFGGEVAAEGEVVHRCFKERGASAIFGGDVHDEVVVVEGLLPSHARSFSGFHRRT